MRAFRVLSTGSGPKDSSIRSFILYMGWRETALFYHYQGPKLGCYCKPLYSAVSLLHLRDRSLERILWIDAICIDQKNDEERAQQIQLMAKIYSQASRVLVWLGEAADDIEGALEDIQHAANGEFTERSNKKMNQKAIFSLLQRPWFQRI